MIWLLCFNKVSFEDYLGSKKDGDVPLDFDAFSKDSVEEEPTINKDSKCLGVQAEESSQALTYIISGETVHEKCNGEGPKCHRKK